MLQFDIANTTYKMPNQLDELSYGKFLAFTSAEGDLNKLQVLLGADLVNLPGTDKVLKQMSGAISQMDAFDALVNDWLTNKTAPAEAIDVDVLGKKLRFDKDLGKLPYWALTKVKAIVKQVGSEPFNEYHHYTSMVANYVYSKFEQYDEYKAEQFGIDVINELPFTSVIKLGDFFLYMQHRLWMRKTDYYSLKFQQKRKMLALMFSLSTEN